jgi:hypothetical protein
LYFDNFVNEVPKGGTTLEIYEANSGVNGPVVDTLYLPDGYTEFGYTTGGAERTDVIVVRKTEGDFAMGLVAYDYGTIKPEYYEITSKTNIYMAYEVLLYGPFVGGVNVLESTITTTEATVETDDISKYSNNSFIVDFTVGFIYSESPTMDGGWAETAFVAMPTDGTQVQAELTGLTPETDYYVWGATKYTRYDPLGDTHEYMMVSPESVKFTTDPPPPTYPFTLGSAVTGPYADKTRDFSYTIEFFDSTGSPLTDTIDYYGSKDGTFSLSYTIGMASITLKHGEMITFSLPAGSKVRVTQTLATPLYTTTYKREGTGSPEQSGNDTGVITMDTARGAGFTNKREYSPPTGVDGGGGWLPPVVLGAALLLTLSLTLRRKLRGLRGG